MSQKTKNGHPIVLTALFENSLCSLSFLMIFLAVMCCFIPGEIENGVIPALTLFGFMGWGLAVVYVEEVRNEIKTMGWRYALGFVLFLLGYTLSLTRGIYGRNLGLSYLTLDLPFLSRLALVPLLTLCWGRIKQERVAELFFLVTLMVCIFGIWGIAQFLNAKLNWRVAFLGFDGPADAGPSRIYHERPVAFAWQMALWIVPVFFLARWDRAFIRQACPLPFYWASLLLALFAGLGTGNRTFILILSLAFATEVFWRVRGGFFKERQKKIFMLVSSIAFAVLILSSPGMKRCFLSSVPNLGFKRAEVWRAQWRAFIDNPVYGVGRKMNRLTLYQDYLPERPLGPFGRDWNAHNLALDLLASMGVFGALGFFLILFPYPERLAHEDLWSEAPSKKYPILFIGVWLAFAMIQSPLETPNMLMTIIVAASFINWRIKATN